MSNKMEPEVQPNGEDASTTTIEGQEALKTTYHKEQMDPKDGPDVTLNHH